MVTAAQIKAVQIILKQNAFEHNVISNVNVQEIQAQCIKNMEQINHMNW